MNQQSIKSKLQLQINNLNKNFRPFFSLFVYKIASLKNLVIILAILETKSSPSKKVVGFYFDESTLRICSQIDEALDHIENFLEP